MSYKFKLTRPGGETRRRTFDAQPSWQVLETIVASLFDIQNNAVAVSYEDSDGDIVTMSSQEELQDYFQTSYKPGQIAKFSVIDKSHGQRPMERNTSSFVEDLDEVPDGGLPTMGPTMFIEVEDGGWQRLPRIPEIFSMQEEDAQVAAEEGHAFVEIVDSDAASSKKDSNPASPEHTPTKGMSTRQSRHKGKQKASPSSQATKSTSAASIVDEDFPTKLPVHIYDVSDTGRSPVGSVQELHEQADRPRGPGAENLMGSFGTVYPVSPPRDAYKEIPRPSEFFDASGRNQRYNFTSTDSESVKSAMQAPGDVPSLDLETSLHGADGTSGSHTPTLGQASSHQSSFVHDVADLVDNLTQAFASHPELSEGVRNIVRNAVGGRYWSTEHDRVSSVAENVRIAAEETSSRITEAVGTMANNAERDAVRVIAEALGGVFRVIGELSGTSPVQPSTTQPGTASGAAPLAPHPPPAHHSSTPGQTHYASRAGWNESQGYQRRMWNAPYYVAQHGPGHNFGYWQSQSGMQGPGAPNPWQSGPIAPQMHPNSFAAQYFDGPVNDDVHGRAARPDLHETKAQLEAAKAVYKAEKERFRQEKEERRKQRREIGQKGAEMGRVQRPDGTTREEEIIARLPLHNFSREGPSKRSYAEVYAAPPHSSSVTASVLPSTHAPAVQPTPFVSTGTSIYSTVDPVPPVPPVPVPAPITAVPSAPPAPPVPPPPPPISRTHAPNIVSPVHAPPGIATEARASAMQSTRAVSAPGPYPWPMPPVHDPSRRRHLTTLRERIQARLFDMGITPASQPDMMDILNACASRSDAPDDDEVLADVLSAMNMRGSPSPRVGSVGMSH